MIVGNGYIARLMKEFETSSTILIFASGVSNSNCIDEKEYEREIKLFRQVIQNHPSHKIVYFSTVSVGDPSLQKKRYIQHKLYMERLISTHHPNHLIFRLPNILSNNQNPHLFLPFILKKIINDEVFELHINSYRYWIEEQDAFRIMKSILTSNREVGTYPIINSYEPISTKDFLEILMKILDKPIKYSSIKEGSYYTAPIERTLPFILRASVPYFLDTSEYMNYIEKSIKKLKIKELWINV